MVSHRTLSGRKLLRISLKVTNMKAFRLLDGTYMVLYEVFKIQVCLTDSTYHGPL